MSKLPTLPLQRRIDRSKIEGYLLHPINGRGKAAFFEAFGFSLSRWEELRDALLEHAASGQVTDAVVSPYGARSLFAAASAHPMAAIHGLWCAVCGRSTQATTCG